MQKEEFKNFISKIDGLINEESCYVLYSLLKDLNMKADVLELGAYKGRVSVALAMAIKERNDKSKIFSIDFNYFKTKEEFVYNIQSFGLKDIIYPIFKPSSLANIGFKTPLKFIFIDTDGKYFSAKAEFILWERFLLKGGIFAISCADSLEIKRFFKECISNSGRFNNYKQIDNIICAYKVKEFRYNPFIIFYIQITYTIYLLFKKILYRLRKNKLFYFLNSKYFKKVLNYFLDKII